MNRNTPAARAARYGVLLALALALAWVESLFPLPIAVPGIKLGLANLVTLIAMKREGKLPALLLSLLRVLLSSVLFSGFSGFLYAASGAMLSWGVMSLLDRRERFSPLGLSVAGGLSHNLGQILMAALVTRSPGIIPAYLPVLLLAGAGMGAVNGLIALGVLRALPGKPKKGENDTAETAEKPETEY